MNSVRLPLSALLLLPALTVFSQPVVGPEVLSDPLPVVPPVISAAVPSVAMARDRTGVAIAWAMPNAQGATRIYVARLNATAHVEGTVREIALASPPPESYGVEPLATATASVCPSLAPSVSGDGFTLAWTEVVGPPPLPYARAAYCQLDAALRPSPGALLLYPINPSAPAIVRSSKSRTWIAVNGVVVEMKENGTVSGSLNGGFASDMTVATDFPQIVGSLRRVVGFTCIPGLPLGPPSCTPQPHLWGCPEECRIYEYATQFSFTALYRTSEETSFSYVSDAQPAVETDGHDLLIAWFDGAQVSGGAVLAARIDPASFDFLGALNTPQRLGTFARDVGPTRPAIATDGERYVVVWRTTSSAGRHDIAGASLDGNGIVTSFSVASSSADELDPSIVAVGKGVFLIAYETVSDVRRIAGRYVTFGARRHAVR